MDKAQVQKMTICALGESDESMALLLKRLAGAAEGIDLGGPFFSLSKSMPSVASALEEIQKDVEAKINYLELVQIDRPADLSTLIREDLVLLREIEQSIQHFLKTISSYFERIRGSQSKHWCLSEQNAAAKSSKQVMD